MTPETALKKAVKQYLTLNGWFVFHVLAGLGSYPGISDMIAIKDGRTVFIELKTPKGRLSPRQELFKADIQASGGEYRVIRSIDDVEAL